MPARRSAGSGEGSTHSVRTRSAEETRALGRQIARSLRPGDVLLLRGPFGAGKTTLVQGIGAGLGIHEPLRSPSFGLVNEYLPGQSGARIPFFHLDLYRLADAAEADDLGLDEYLGQGGVLAVEWPEVALAQLPADYLDVRLDPLDDAASDDVTTSERPSGDGRAIVLTPTGPESRRLLAGLVVDVDPGDR